MNITIPIEVSGDIWYNEVEVQQKLQELLQVLEQILHYLPEFITAKPREVELHAARIINLRSSMGSKGYKLTVDDLKQYLLSHILVNMLNYQNSGKTFSPWLDRCGAIEGMHQLQGQIRRLLKDQKTACTQMLTEVLAAAQEVQPNQITVNSINHDFIAEFYCQGKIYNLDLLGGTISNDMAVICDVPINFSESAPYKRCFAEQRFMGKYTYADKKFRFNSDGVDYTIYWDGKGFTLFRTFIIEGTEIEAELHYVDLDVSKQSYFFAN